MRPASGGGPVLSVAPMMDWTDRHFRYLLRQLTSHTLLYTEMVNMNAILHGDRERHLGYSEAEHPLSLQLGGDDPKLLAQCAAIAQSWGYDEVNLNVGCPSPRVARGNFGACLMAQPELVRECLQAMREAVTIRVTVKHRIGIDERDSYEEMARFVDVVAPSGAQRFTVHARKAWLQGLSPRENREIPPLRYDDVYRLKRDFPELEIELNGGVRSLADAAGHLEWVDAVMIGRAAYEEPFMLGDADARLFGATEATPTRGEVVERMLPYLDEQLVRGVPLHRITRHMLGLFNGRPGAKAWRRKLSEKAHLPGTGPELLLEALSLVPQLVREERAAGSAAAVA
ncbi:MAG TPA: tRNA dihydrouridine(20/20a) synthase DusA [Trueperaceae bacterium]